MSFRPTPLLRLRRNVLCTVLLALALAQTLGLLHRIAHGPHLGRSGQVQSFDAGRVASDGAAWLKALFAGHDSAQGCDLYEQMSHADLAPGSAPDLPAVLPSACGVVFHPGWHLATQAAGFLARGPPARG